MQTTATPSLPVSSFTIARYNAKFMPSFDITSTGWDSSKQSSGIHSSIQTHHFNARLIENTYGIQ
jgi:hypothetical protein